MIDMKLIVSIGPIFRKELELEYVNSGSQKDGRKGAGHCRLSAALLTVFRITGVSVDRTNALHIKFINIFQRYENSASNYRYNHMFDPFPSFPLTG